MNEGLDLWLLFLLIVFSLTRLLCFGVLQSGFINSVVAVFYFCTRWLSSEQYDGLILSFSLVVGRSRVVKIIPDRNLAVFFSYMSTCPTIKI